MTDHMWKLIEEDLPEGCVYIEVMYENDKVGKMCSCDVHWDKYNNVELPLYWREDLQQ